jgi:hypothetical protein
MPNQGNHPTCDAMSLTFPEARRQLLAGFFHVGGFSRIRFGHGKRACKIGGVQRAFDPQNAVRCYVNY